jgi:hypothetical protein
MSGEIRITWKETEGDEGRQRRWRETKGDGERQRRWRETEGDGRRREMEGDGEKKLVTVRTNDDGHVTPVPSRNGKIQHG